MKPAIRFGLLLIIILLSACSQGKSMAPTEPAGRATTSETISEANEDTVEATAPANAQAQPERPDAAPTIAPTSAADPTVAPAEPEAPGVTGAPIEVTYFTPPQGEGPYYPINKLDDRDNDLTVLNGAPGDPVGQIVELTGTVYDASGTPQPGVLVEIWQTDASGVYLHPGDPGTDQRDRNFQFYGESLTTDVGRYSFRTILPGRYEPRPRHIHVKVKVDGQELLTTQFYFADDPELAGELMFAQVGPEGQHLVIVLEEAKAAGGNVILVGQRDIILNMVL